MKEMLLLILILLQTSCSSARVNRTHDGIDEEFLGYMSMFIADSQGKVTKEDFDDLTMGFRDYPKNDAVIGTCWPMIYFTEISISRESWNSNHSYYWRKGKV